MFFNPLSKSDSNYKVLATAQLTITDQTDASNLAGNLTVINSSKNQTFITGTTQPYSPNWKINNLVFRPYMIATNVYRGSSDNKYNPDLFDPKEYPDLTNPEDIGVSSSYINDIQWYIVDTANNQTLIDVTKPEFKDKFSHTWTYTIDQENILCTDKRTLVVQDNILNKDEIRSIIVKFSFHDPFADIKIPVTYETSISNISTGMGASKAFINAIDGNSFYNADEKESIRLEASYLNEGNFIDLDDLLASATSNLKIEWFIKTHNGWTLLDPVTQDTNEWNEFYELHVVTERAEDGQILTTEKTNNVKGGTILVVKPGLIAGSNIIKMTITDDMLSSMQSSALETVYDYSDPTQCYVHSSNGDKLFKGIEAPGTILSAVVTYKGELLESGDDRYNTMFDYYWYRIDSAGENVDNIYIENGKLMFIDTKDPNYTIENGYPKSSTRSLDIEPKHIDNKATFTCDLLNKKDAEKMLSRSAMIRSLPTEEELLDGKVLIMKAGLNEFDYQEIFDAAMEIRAYTIAQEDNIINNYEKSRGE